MNPLRAIKIERKTAAMLGIAATIGLGTAQAQADYHQGFESNTDDWTLYPDATLTRVASNAGTLGLPSSSGGYHAEITNDQDAYTSAANYGQAGFTYYGGRSGTYSGPTTQSLDIYVDTTWAAAASPNNINFSLNMAPANTSGTTNGAGESNFRFYVNDANDTVTINAHDEGPMATITSSGWYTFEMTFAKAAVDTDPFQITLSIYDSLGDLVGTLTHDSKDAHAQRASSHLGTGGYAWVTVWQNGFANDIVAIDNAYSNIPEPASLGLLAAGGLMLVKRRRTA